MWNRPDEYAFMTNERMNGREGMGIGPTSEFPFMEAGGARVAGAGDALTRWAQATREHHSLGPWSPHYAPPPRGYQDPFTYGLFGLGSSPGRPGGSGGLARLAMGALGAWMLYKGTKGKNRRAKKGEGYMVAGLGVGLVYAAWRG